MMGESLLCLKIHEFNDMIRKLRKEVFGKGPERIHTVLSRIWLYLPYTEISLRQKIYCQYTRRAENGACCKDEYDSRFI